jgi:hypothetical protein
MNRSELVLAAAERIFGAALKVAGMMHLGKEYSNNLLNNLVERLECTQSA